MVTEIGNVGEEETSTAGLAFASDIWTYMTSHILVMNVSALVITIAETCSLQGIYPVIIVILVSKQRSYIEATTSIATDHTPRSNYTGSTNSRLPWGSRHTERSGNAIQINVHEMRMMRGGSNMGSERLADDSASESIKKIQDTEKALPGVVV